MNNLHFGIVKKYLPERGFGFLTHPISLGPNQDIFFHITKILNSNKIIAEKLTDYDENSQICFWYLSETTKQGTGLKKIVKTENVLTLFQDNIDAIGNKVELIFKNIDRPLPFWIDQVSIGLLGLNGKEKLYSERDNLIELREKLKQEQAEIRRKAEEEELRQLKELMRQRAEIRRKAEEEKQRQIEEQKRQRVIEEEEFELLVAEVMPLGFKKSSQVSLYIVKK